MMFASLSMDTLIPIGLAGISVALFSLAVMQLATSSHNSVNRRVRSLSRDEDQPLPLAWLQSVLQPFKKLQTPGKGFNLDDTRLFLVRAGFRQQQALQFFFAIRGLTAVVIPGLVLTAILLVFTPGMQLTVVLLAVALLLGLRLPLWILKKLASRRQQRIALAVPDAIDLLTVCVEAGLGLRAALQRVVGELQLTHRALVEELEQANAEMLAGVSAEQALQNLAKRIDTPMLDGLVNTLLGSLRFGASIGESLRGFAADSRDRQLQQAEEKAAKVGVKLIFPLMLCLMPAFLIVAVGPAILRLVDVLKNAF
ncbi:MAG: type II secretion system F family protein [Endozoicomonas sp.]